MKTSNKYVYFIGIVYTLSLVLAPFTVFYFFYKFHLLSFTPNFIFSFIQRSVALMILPMMALQIYLGANLTNLISGVGGWIAKFHYKHGIVIYSLILAHTLSFVVLKYFANRILDPFYVFTDFCVLCQVRGELFYTFGRLAFWLLTFSVFAAYFRNTDTFKKHWRLFHYMNYFIFILALIHSFYVGSDVLSTTYIAVYIISSILVFYTIFQRVKRIYLEIK